MESFTPISALAGGALIGIAAAILLYANGRIAGVSGILFGLLSPTRADSPWRVAFVVGLVAGAGLFGLLKGGNPPISVTTSWPLLIVGGLLVGAGTVAGNGCTSGHGVCGISRLSGRSITATITFMAAAAATVFISRHVVGA
ncbi:MAG: YeeE/YedE family protein [Proteobacteria bacterium]|nr:YeeE/YedE family protein [Pseudomonadota bacterium]